MKLTLPFLLLAILSLTLANKDEEEWKVFKQKYRKKHRPNEEVVRRKNFIATQRNIEKQNKANKPWKAAHSKFSDMTDDERSSHLGGVPFLPQPEDGPLPGEQAPLSQGGEEHPDGAPDVLLTELVDTRQLPASLDYRNDSCMQPIQDQGQCGSCWSFGAANVLEFSRCKRTGRRVSLSVQQLLDCDKSNNACNGGSFYRAWNYLIGGSMTSQYAYTSATSKTAGTCRFDASKVAAKTEIFGRVSLTGTTPAPNPSACMTALSTYGPLATNMRVISSLYTYKTGVYDDPACNANTTFTGTNHIVVVVGYGSTSAGIPYWIVRNTWGDDWGLGGYFFVRRGNDRCFIETWMSYVRAAA